MASLKEIKSRINSIKNTRKITSAMKMVASAKLHRAQNAIENMLPYQRKMNRILTNFLSSTGMSEISFDSPFSVQRPVKRVAIVIISSNSSLCGAFNSNLIKRFAQVADEYKELGQENLLIYPIGKKIEVAVKKMGYEIQGSYQQMADKPSYEEAARLAATLMDLYLQEELDRVELIYHHFKSAGSQVLMQTSYLPIDMEEVEHEASENNGDQSGKFTRSIDYIVEPSVQEFIASLIPTVLKLKLFTALLDSGASEHAARMFAMQVATDNANDLIQELTVQYNKSRQQAITNELLDIIGGSMK